MAGPMPGAEQGAPEQAEGGAGGGEFMQLVQNIMKGMSLLGEGLEGAGAPPEVLEGLSGVMSQFEQVIGGLGGGGGQKQGASQLQEAQGSPVSPAGV